MPKINLIGRGTLAKDLHISRKTIQYWMSFEDFPDPRYVYIGNERMTYYWDPEQLPDIRAWRAAFIRRHQ